MRSAIVTGLSAIGFVLAGWAMPIAYPKIDPLIAKASLIVAATLLLVALVLWFLDRNKREQSPPSFSQTHSGSGHNIIADAVNFGPKPFAMTEQIMQEVAANLRAGEPVIIGYSDSRGSKEMALRLKDYLSGQGFPHGGTVGGRGPQSNISGLDPATPVSIHPNGLLGGMIGGSVQAVYVDASIPA